MLRMPSFLYLLRRNFVFTLQNRGKLYALRRFVERGLH